MSQFTSSWKFGEILGVEVKKDCIFTLNYISLSFFCLIINNKCHTNLFMLTTIRKTNFLKKYSINATHVKIS